MVRAFLLTSAKHLSTDLCNAECIFDEICAVEGREVRVPPLPAFIVGHRPNNEASIKVCPRLQGS